MDYAIGPVLVLGATGYVGGRLVPLLLDRGLKVRAAGRSDRKIQGRPWGNHPNLEIVVADALDTPDLTEAMRGCRTVFYLFHSVSQVYETSSPDVLTWRELFRIYAEEAGLPHRFFLVLPLRIHQISIWWMNLVTPVSVALIRPLVERMRDEILCHDVRIRQIIPQRLLTCREAIAKALKEVNQNEVASSCFDAGSTHLPEWAGGQAQPEVRVFRDTFSVTLDCPPELAWNVVKRIGGNTGWYFGTFLWRMRGFVDELLGGPGLSRGRRHVDSVAMGDHLDFWRVVAVEEPNRLLLRAEMLAPGEAFLEFRIQVLEDGATELRMTSSFQPRGFGARSTGWSSPRPTP